MRTKLFKHIINFAVVLMAFVGSTFCLAADLNYVSGKYTIDAKHTRVSFVVPHFVISQVEGRFNDVSGDFTIAKPFSKSTVNVSVAIGSVDTGVSMRDDDLRLKRFFDSATYPTMKFVSKSISGMPDSFTVVGLLTIKDVTKEVSFKGKYTGSLKDPWGNQRAVFYMNGNVNRHDFHVDYDEPSALGPGIGSEVSITIQTDGTLDKKK